MANFRKWLEQTKTIDPTSFFDIKDTVKTYSEIRNLGLRTAEWIEFTGKELHPRLNDLVDAIYRLKPCLFIWDPKDDSAKYEKEQILPPLKKGFLMNQYDHVDVFKWILATNVFDIERYDYLVTSQAMYSDNSYCGSVFSDGKGNLICETDHEEGVLNHRNISQSNKSLQGLVDFFVIEDFELESFDGNHLSYEDIVQIRQTYETLRGYFEFVKGNHLGKIEIVTTGHEKLRESGIMSYPSIMHIPNLVDTNKRISARILEEF